MGNYDFDVDVRTEIDHDGLFCLTENASDLHVIDVFQINLCRGSHIVMKR